MGQALSLIFGGGDTEGLPTDLASFRPLFPLHFAGSFTSTKYSAVKGEADVLLADFAPSERGPVVGVAVFSFYAGWLVGTVRRSMQVKGTFVPVPRGAGERARFKFEGRRAAAEFRALGDASLEGVTTEGQRMKLTVKVWAVDWGQGREFARYAGSIPAGSALVCEGSYDSAGPNDVGALEFASDLDLVHILREPLRVCECFGVRAPGQRRWRPGDRPPQAAPEPRPSAPVHAAPAAEAPPAAVEPPPPVVAEPPPPPAEPAPDAAAAAAADGNGNDDEDDAWMCVVCMDGRKNVAMVPCGHVCLCEGCAGDLGPDPRCPMCRAQGHAVKIFF